MKFKHLAMNLLNHIRDLRQYKTTVPYMNLTFLHIVGFSAQTMGYYHGLSTI